MPRILIDGYNLLHATDVFGQGALEGTLQGSREALLAFLAARLTSRERRGTTIVFDAAGAPPGLPSEHKFEGLQVRFARDYADADAMLEALIEKARAPKELLVVSGDRRVQRAARSRGAAWMNSTEWYRQVRDRLPQDGEAPPSKRPAPAGVGDVDYWVNEFNDAPAVPGEPPPPTSHATHSAEKTSSPPPTQQPDATEENPFPPGYADEEARELDGS
jgi:predicted RNA-binding protein with PIN domain